MPEDNFNSLTIAQHLESAGIERDRAQAIAMAISHGTEHAVKKDIESAIGSLRSEIELVANRWIIRVLIFVLIGLSSLIIPGVGELVSVRQRTPHGPPIRAAPGPTGAVTSRDSSSPMAP